MVYLIVDTCNWIYLATSKDPQTDKFEERHFKLFSNLIQKIESGEVKLLLCSIIEKEWQKHKEDTAKGFIKKLQNELIEYGNIINKIKNALQDESDKENITKVFEKYKEAIDIKIKLNEEHIDKIDLIIEKAKKYEISVDTKAFVSDWAVDKNAPFKGDKKNSMADALIFFGAVAFIEEISKLDDLWSGEVIYEYPTSIFVSSNKGDFASLANKKEIHEDLKPFAEKIELNFYTNLPEALNFVQEQVKIAEPLFNEEDIRLIEESLDEFDEDWYICDVCSPDNMYANMVYFSEPYEIEYFEKRIINLNQLEIDFKDLENIPISKPIYKIRIGECSWCYTTHLICFKCNEVTALSGETEHGFECEGCGTKYIVKSEYDRKGILSTEIFLSHETEDENEDENE